MKIILLILLLSFSHLVFSQKDTVINVSTGWTFSLGKSTKLFQANVPGSIYTDLQNNGLIENPFYGINEQKVQWVADSIWNYKNTLIITSEIMLNQHIELECEGIDTYSKIWVNDSLVFSTNNMFRTWKKEIKHLLRFGINEIRIEFKPVSEIAKIEAEKLQYVLSNEERVFVRKAQYQFGWDFAPKLKGCAIWRPIKLNLWNDYKIENVQIIQKQITKKIAKISSILEINSIVNSEINLQIIDDKTGRSFFSNKIVLKKGNQKIKAEFNIDNPKLWWCNGMGEPYLYDISINLLDNNGNVKTAEINLGIRTIEIVQQKDKTGKSFYFKLNGIPVFAKGANYIPENYFTSKNDSTAYSRVINDAVKSNMNMLRVWGGGVYEENKFYDLCDKNGILVWQDFMFACAMYPGDNKFLENVKQEAIDNIKRLRNHPSIAMWCGNNEISEGWYNWGWQQQYNYSKVDSLKILNDYQNLFQKVLPKVITDYDSSRFYWPSSPEIGWGKKESLLQGDCHYWGIWWGMEPFENYKNKVGRFMSEYGFQGMPALKTIREMCDSTELDLNSLALKTHQKHSVGYETIQTYIENEYSKPKNIEDFIYKSQLTQADGIKTAIEAHRRAKPYCMGTLYWQMNDCWPAVSWSGIDYYGRWKAMQYTVKEAYQNQILSILQRNDSVFIYAISDNLLPTKNKVEINLFSFDGKCLFNKEMNVDILPQSSKIIFKIKQTELVKDSIINSVVFTAGFKDNTSQRESLFYFSKTKFLNLIKTNIEVNLYDNNEGFDIILKSKYLIKGMCLSIDDKSFFSENYFDMIPNKEYLVHCKTNFNNEKFKQKFKYNYITNY